MEERRPDVVVVGGGSTNRGGWSVVMALGIVAVVFGLIVLANIWGSVRLVAILVGLALVFVGVMQLTSALRGQRRTGRTIAGALVVLLGIVLIAWPESSVKSVAVLVGLGFLFWGVVVAVAAAVDRADGWPVPTTFGVLLAALGIAVIAWPGLSVAALTALVGAGAVVLGASLIVQALLMQRR